MSTGGSSRTIRTLRHRLMRSLRRGQPARFTQNLGGEATNAFDELVKPLIAPPVLALPRGGLPYEVDTDASDYQVFAALFQVHPSGERKPNGVWSS